MHNYLIPLAETRQVGTKGYGSFVRQDIGRGSIIATFGGQVANLTELAKYPDERRRRSMQIEVDLYLVGPVVREPGDCINHSCAPNCGMRNATQLVSMHDIQRGSELTFDYAMSDSSDYDEFECSCSTKMCRGFVAGGDWRLEDVRQRYVGYFSPYIQRLIRSSQNSRLLSKREVEHLLAEVDDSPVAAVLKALRVVIGIPFASWETAIAMYCNSDARQASLLNREVSSVDRLTAELNETRGATYRDFGIPSGKQLRTASARLEPSRSPQ
ncbi:MAG: SET domain-containing protein-lysine N-methyltransferase [Ilumatobacteraceae bacterium]